MKNRKNRMKKVFISIATFIICSSILTAGWNYVGDPNGSTLDIAIGNGRNDGVSRVYVATNNDNINEFTYSPSGWSRVIVGSGGDDMNAVAIGNGRNDGIMRVYGGNADSYIYEFTYSASTWSKVSIGSVGSPINDIAIGRGRNDGITRIYAAANDGHIYEFTYSGGSWNKVSIGSAGAAMKAIAIGNGRNDGVIRVYGACADYHIYEFTYSGGVWIKNDIGAGGNVMNDVAIGNGRNDGIVRIYGANSDYYVYEFTYLNGSWVTSVCGSVGYYSCKSVVVGNTRHDGITRVYAGNSYDYVYEFTYQSGEWKKVYLGYSRKYLSIGNGRNDGKNRLYAGGEYVYEYNNDPVLTWTGETNYTSDGLHPENGDTSTVFVYRVKYIDADGDPPKSGYPKVYIKKGGYNIFGSPFSMTYVSGSYNTGAIYTFSTTLSTGTDYTYYFEAQDVYGAQATGAPTSSIDAPDVKINNPPTLSWTGETNYISDGVHPESGDRTTTFVFRVKYTDIDNDAPKSGYPKVHIKKGGVSIPGSPFSMTYVSGNYNTGAIYTFSTTLSPGTDYTYYFEAQDIYGETAVGNPTIETTGPLYVIANPPVINEVKVYHGIFKIGKEKTYIFLNLQEEDEVKIDIYDSTGKKVKKLYHGIASVGNNIFSWNGTDDNNNHVSSGVYIIRIETPKIKQQKKVVVIR